MKNTFKLIDSDLSVTVHEARVGQIIDLLSQYLQINDIHLASINMASISEHSEKIFNIGSLMKSLPMVETLINSLVEIEDADGKVGSYRDLSVTDVMIVIGHLKKVNAYFLELLGVITTPEPTAPLAVE